MAWNLIPTIASLIQQFLGNIEGFLNQTTPMGNKAYNRVIAGAQGMIAGGLYRYAADRAKAVLASTAVGTDLDAIGAEFGLVRNAAVAAVVQINLPCSDGTVLALATSFQGPNGLVYQNLSAATAPSSGLTGTGITVLVSCLSTGSQGNLGVSSVLPLLQTQAGVTGPATVTSITATGCVTGTDTQDDPTFRQQILAVERAYGGGGNAADYRTWSLAVNGVQNAFPYAGLPYYGALNAANEYAAQAINISGSPTGGNFTLTFNGQTTATIAYNAGASAYQTALQALTGAASVAVSLLANGAFLVTGFTVYAPIQLGTNSLTGGTAPTVWVNPNAPPARTVYIECTPAVADSGIPPQSLLNTVTAAIQKNSQGLANQPLGLSMDSLYVMPIKVTSFYVLVTSLSVPSGQVGTVQAAVLSAVQSFFNALVPYIDGVDPPFTRNDLITSPNISSAVQAVLKAYGASCQAVGFGIAAGSYLSTYQLGQGEQATLATGGLTWL